jgi:ankyrin repeat protein
MVSVIPSLHFRALPTSRALPSVPSPPPPATTHSLLCKPGRGFARFVNVRDDHGATPLHLAARQGRPGCVQALLENGAIVSALTGSYGYGSKVSCSSWLQLLTCTVRRCRFPGSTSLHLAARSGSLDCTRKLLAWGADRLRRDSAG